MNPLTSKKFKPFRGVLSRNTLPQHHRDSQANVGELSQYSSANFDAPAIPQQFTVDESSTNGDDLSKYRPLEWSQSISPQPVATEKPQEQYDDLEAYKSSDFGDKKVSGIEALGSYESSSIGVTEMANEMTENYTPVKWNEPDGLEPTTAEQKSKDYDDLENYQVGFVAKNAVLEAHEKAQLDTTVKGQPLAPRVETVLESKANDYEDLRSYGPFKWNEPDGLPTKTTEESSKDYDDLKQYQEFDNSDPTVERVHPEGVIRQYKDLSQYPAQGFEEPIMAAQARPEDGSKSYDLHKYETTQCDLSHKDHTAHTNPTSSREAASAYSAETIAAANKVADAVAAGLKEFNMISRSKDDTPRLPVAIRPSLALQFQSVSAEELGEPEASSMDESFPPESNRLREVINRLSGQVAMTPAQKMAVESDPYSKSPQGLETSYEMERGDNAVWPMTARHHQGRLAADEAEFALFKMMAYDSGTKSVSIAEVSSSAQDNTRAANPAEAILQLAHPSKFFPHFALLQQQGYEIVSGGPDVLVFKKVREASEYLKPQKKRTSRGKRIILGTIGLAGSAYALSVFSEYFSTGTF